MPGVRKDLAPAKKRKRVAYNTKGRPKAVLEYRRSENYVSDDAQRPLLQELVKFANNPKRQGGIVQSARKDGGDGGPPRTGREYGNFPGKINSKNPARKVKGTAR